MTCAVLSRYAAYKQTRLGKQQKVTVLYKDVTVENGSTLFCQPLDSLQFKTFEYYVRYRFYNTVNVGDTLTLDLDKNLYKNDNTYNLNVALFASITMFAILFLYLIFCKINGIKH